jgi:hypothetical protein
MEKTMRTICLLLVLVLFGCSTEGEPSGISGPTDDPPPPDDLVTRVRVSNATPADLELIKLSFPNFPIPIDFGAVRSHTKTEYQEVRAAYTFVHAELHYSSGEMVLYEPELAASEKLAPGYYTYRVVWECSGMVIRAKRDEPSDGGAPPIVTSVSLTPSEVKVGDDVVITITLWNVTSSDIPLPVSWRGNPVGYAVSTLDGLYLGAYPLCVPTGKGTLYLLANEKRSFEWTLDTELPPAQYVVRGGVLGRGDEYPWGSQVLAVK